MKPRTQISIKLDTDLLERIDKLASDVGISRTAVIEQAVKNDLPEQESFHKSLENPVIRAMHEKLTSPGVLRMLAKLAQTDMSDEEISEIVEKGPRQRDAARARRTKKKGKSTTGLEGTS
jgi:metal-responsive CopG/Arc/MetJ family transcriptional regulator